MFTHESMHVRGERNEARTECEAVQRNYRAAKLLGVPDATAKRNALDYYNNLYKERGKSGQHAGRLLFGGMRARESHGRASERFDMGTVSQAFGEPAKAMHDNVPTAAQRSRIAFPHLRP